MGPKNFLRRRSNVFSTCLEKMRFCKKAFYSKIRPDLAPWELRLGGPKKLPTRAVYCFVQFVWKKHVFVKKHITRRYGQICHLRSRVLVGPKNILSGRSFVFSTSLETNMFLWRNILLEDTARFSPSGTASWQAQKTSYPGGWMCFCQERMRRVLTQGR